MRSNTLLVAICGAATVALIFLSQPFAVARAAIPLAVDCRNSAIISPSAGAVLAGAVEIRGRANVLDFRFYKVEFAPAGTDNWALIGPDVIRAPVLQEGRLVVWQTTITPDGVYRLRMHVVDPSGNYCELFVQPITVANSNLQFQITPSPSLTPTDTETPVLTAVQPQATLTPRPGFITDVIPLRTPSLAPNNRGLPLPDVNLIAFGSIFALGACGMGSVIAIIYVVTRVMNRNPKSDG